MNLISDELMTNYILLFYLDSIQRKSIMDCHYFIHFLGLLSSKLFNPIIFLLALEF